jgi:hypothetical protein
MTALYVILAMLACIWQLWIIYVAVMRLKMVRDAGKLTAVTKPLAYATLAAGLVLDLLVNAVIGSILFRELPKEWTLSARLTRHSNALVGWRRGRAIKLRTALLDNIDPAGVHTG